MLLDVDGTLIGSNFAHAESWTQALREHGVTVDARPPGRFVVLRGGGYWSEVDLRDAIAILDDPPALLARWRGDSR